jgi:hypothetical protein
MNFSLFHVLCIQERITDRISHAAGLSVFLDIINKQHNALTLFECLQTASMPCHRINKLGTHVHHRDRSAAAAIFANGTYFLDTLHILYYWMCFIITR